MMVSYLHVSEWNWDKWPITRLQFVSLQTRAGTEVGNVSLSRASEGLSLQSEPPLREMGPTAWRRAGLTPAKAGRPT